MSNAVCQFHLRGNCRFGARCRNRHVDAQVQQGGFQNNNTHNRFGALSNNSNESFGRGDNKSEQLLFNAASITEDMKLQNIWPLSCYGPDRTTYPPINLISGLDYSFEEIRWEAYQERALTGNIQNYMHRTNDLIQQAQRRKLEIMREPEKAFLWMTQAIRDAKSRSTSPFTGGGGSVFGSAVAGGGGGSAFAPQAVSAFAVPSSQPSAFGQPAATSGAAFGQPSQPSSFFGQQAQPQVSAFQAQPVFGQPALQNAVVPSQPQSAFGQPSQPQSAFGQPSQPQSAFGQPAITPSAFGQPALTQSPPPAGLPAFGQAAFDPAPTPQTGFGQVQLQPAFGHPQPPQPVSSTLPADVLALWSSAEFEFGRIPEDEPPMEVR